VYVCSCFGITESQVRERAAAGASTPRQIASQSRAGTDCGSCVRRIQSILGRGGCPRREALQQAEAQDTADAVAVAQGTAPEPVLPAAPLPLAAVAAPAREGLRHVA
jgi:bacterioferritin-associated ferredoxin